MELFPIFAKLKNIPVLVIGAGEIATRKIHALLEAGAIITVCAPKACEAVLQWVADQKITWLSQNYSPDVLDNQWLVIAATDIRELNQIIAADAFANQKLINVVDDPELSSFQVPSIVDRSPLILGISSSGIAPMLARKLREKLETEIDPYWGYLAQSLEHFRPDIKKAFPDMARRRLFYTAVINHTELRQALAQKQFSQAASLIQNLLAQPNISEAKRLIIVGTGTGSNADLSLSGLRALNDAEFILYEHTVSSDILSLARRDANRLVVKDKSHWAEQLTKHLDSSCLVCLLPFDQAHDIQHPLVHYVNQHHIAYECVRGVSA